MPNRMLRAVLDTSVLISGLHAPDGPPGQVLYLARKGAIQNITSRFILTETERILAEKLLWEDKKIRQALRWIQSFSLTVNPRATLEVVSHHADNRILECALEGKAEYLVSGDRHLKELERFETVEIVSPAAFLALVVQTARRRNALGKKRGPS